jgi:hypothetical protein
VNLPLLINVPIVFPASGGFLLTLPLAAGDEVLVVFASRCIDSWWQSGGVGRPMEARMHDLSDGFAIPGPRSQAKLPGAAVSTTKAQLRNNAGTVYLQVGTKFAMKNASTDLKTTLSDLVAAVNGFMATVAALGLSPPGTNVTNTMIAPAAITSVADLAAVLTKINNLLEDA